MMEFLASIVGALSAGALAKTKELGGRTVSDAYDALRTLIVDKLGKGGAVQSVEDEPHSELTQGALAEALAKSGCSADSEIAIRADALRTAIASVSNTGNTGIEIGHIFGKTDVLVKNLVASGRIKLGEIRADTGGAVIANLAAGVHASKKA